MFHRRGKAVEFIQKNWKLILTAIGIIVVGMFVYRQFFTLYIWSTNPNLSSVSYQTPFIELHFNKSIAEKSLKLDDPSSIIDSSKTKFSNKSVRFYTKVEEFEVDERESFRISLTSTDGYSLSNKEVSFIIKDISFDQLPEDQQKVIKELENQKPDYYVDPIFNYIPYSTLEYSIQPNFIETADSKDTQQNALALDVTVYIPEAERSNETEKIKLYLSQAKKYISSKGLNPDDYLINLIVSGS